MGLTNPLNAEAGQVPAPDDPREIAAAVRANAIMRRAIPYLELRYGERGKRFGDSDGGYLLTLLGYDQPTIDKQIDWMAGLLAARGMPTLILELHLRTLARLLQRAFRDPARGAPLLVSADRLRAKRRARLNDTIIAELAAHFAERAGFPARRWARGAGVLIACAVADELNGLKLAVESLDGWIADRSRFPRPWVEAVRATVRSARRIGAGHEP
jgi:hypothetical protein